MPPELASDTMEDQLPAPPARMSAATVTKYVMITMGVATMRALGMTFCGFSISPASVLMDSQPAYIHIITARPRFMLSTMFWPLGMNGLNTAPVPLANA